MTTLGPRLANYPRSNRPLIMRLATAWLTLKGFRPLQFELIHEPHYDYSRGRVILRRVTDGLTIRIPERSLVR